MRAHIISGGKVTNTIEVESLGFMPNLLDAALGGKIGDMWNGSVFSTSSSDLIAMKITKTAQINQWRSDANQSTFTHLTKVIACDALSRSDIDAVAGSVAMNGAFPVGFPNAWKAVDNTYLSLPTVADFKLMYNSMTAQGSINFGRSQTLKTALAAALTQAQIDVITW